MVKDIENVWKVLKPPIHLNFTENGNVSVFKIMQIPNKRDVLQDGQTYDFHSFPKILFLNIPLVLNNLLPTHRDKDLI